MAGATPIATMGHLAYQTDGAGNKLATFTYAANGVPSSVVIGSGTSTPRYYYVYNGHGDVVALVDSVGTVVASYSYDAFGNLTSSSESLPNGWSNPYRYDGAEGVRYDGETGLYWLSVRAYDPTLGRFLSHDPLGRLAAWGIDFQPYVYGSNNPLVNTDPSGLISCPVRIDGQCQSYWFKASNNPSSASTIQDIDGCSESNPCRKYHIVHCSENTYRTDDYYWDPRCQAWRKWNANQDLQKAAVQDLEADAGHAYIFNANIALAYDGVSMALGIAEGGVSGYLAAAAAGGDILANMDNLIHGHDLLGDHSLDDLGTTLEIARHAISGVLRVLQALWNGGGFFLRLLGDAALSSIPLGWTFKTVGWLLSNVVLPLAAGAFQFSYAAALALEKRASDENNLSIGAWCSQYGQGKCAPYAPESFIIYGS